MAQGHVENPDKGKTWTADKARMSMHEWWRQWMETAAMLGERAPSGTCGEDYFRVELHKSLRRREGEEAGRQSGNRK